MEFYDETPLDLARNHGHVEIVDLLKSAGGKSHDELEGEN
jgi:hypothetical protein